MLPDTPDAIRGEYGDYDPQDFSHRHLGPVRVREALACSLNVPAIMALSQVGARSAFYELHKWGFDFPGKLDNYGAGFILGNAWQAKPARAVASGTRDHGGIIILGQPFRHNPSPYGIARESLRPLGVGVRQRRQNPLGLPGTAL